MNSPWQVAVPAGAELGERPVWDGRAGEIVWVDIPAGQVHAYRDHLADRVVVRADTSVGAAAPRAGGGYVLAAGDGFRLVDAAGRAEGSVRRPAGMGPEHRFNDGACDPAGRFYAGTTTFAGIAGASVLYRLDPDASIHVVATGITESNGLAWSPDGSRLYYVDSGGPTIWVHAYDPDTARLGARHILVDIEAGAGVPDGLATDAEGGVWVALWGGGSVRRYEPDGRLSVHLDLPVPLVTCPGFGGPGLDELYVTSAWQGMSRAERVGYPMAGHVFCTRPGVRGQPVTPFAG
ncbi:MAG: SMP-30/gluconolactonase/LRE family protein [Actinomycetes bacterium]